MQTGTEITIKRCDGSDADSDCNQTKSAENAIDRVFGCQIDINLTIFYHKQMPSAFEFYAANNKFADEFQRKR